MSDDSALTQEVGPEVVTEAHVAEGQVQDQTAEGEGKSSPPEEEANSPAKARRERDKAYKQQLRERADRAESELRAAQDRLQKIRSADQSDKPPTEADYPDYADLAAAKAVWMMQNNQKRQAESEAEAQFSAAQQEAQRISAAQSAALHQHWMEQSKEAEGRYADFQQVVAQPGLFPEGSALVSMIVQSPQAADLAYALAMDRASHDALLQMHPLDAARELGRIEATLSAPRPKTATTAPAPISPVKGGVGAGKRPSEMSPTEYRQWRESGGKF